jgi:hypothetical protein
MPSEPLTYPGYRFPAEVIRHAVSVQPRSGHAPFVIWTSTVSRTVT